MTFKINQKKLIEKIENFSELKQVNIQNETEIRKRFKKNIIQKEKIFNKKKFKKKKN